MTTLHDFGGVLGQHMDTFFWALAALGMCVKWPKDIYNVRLGVKDQCSRLESSVPFKWALGLQSIPLSKQPLKTQPRSENEDITGSPQYNLHATRTNKRRTLSLQEVELDGLIHNPSYYVESMHHIIYAQV